MTLFLLLAGFASFSSGNGTMNIYSAKTLQRGNLAFNWHTNFSGHEYSPGDTLEAPTRFFR